MDYLNDKDFLKQITEQQERTTFARIIALNFYEEPVEEITGRVTSGSISINGSSSLRRTCNLSLQSQNLNLNNFLWSLNTKFKLEIGIKNNIDINKYPEIIWFPQGIFVITSFQNSLSTNTMNINISGKDKMCLLNGEVSGQMNQQTALDGYQIPKLDSTGKLLKYDTIKYPVKDIILDLVHLYGNENFQNIIISDLDEYGTKMIEWNSNTPVYTVIPLEITNEVENKVGPITQTLLTLKPKKDPDFQILTFLDLNNTYVCESGNIYTPNNTSQTLGIITIQEVEDEDGNIKIQKVITKGWEKVDKNTEFCSFLEREELSQPIFAFKVGDGYSYGLVYKISRGDIIGYEATDLVYSDELVLKAGEPITAALDKICEMFGNSYEYFYNTKGQFIFQEKKDYLSSSYTPYEFFREGVSFGVKNQDNEFIYTFDSTKLVSSISINPQSQKIKNDFIVYGQNEKDQPIHLRYAIDKKPEIYIPYYDYWNETVKETGLNKRPKHCYTTNMKKAKEFIVSKWGEEEMVADRVPHVPFRWSQMIYPSLNKEKGDQFISMSYKNYQKCPIQPTPGMEIAFVKGSYAGYQFDPGEYGSTISYNYVIESIESTSALELPPSKWEYSLVGEEYKMRITYVEKRPLGRIRIYFKNSSGYQMALGLYEGFNLNYKLKNDNGEITKVYRDVDMISLTYSANALNLSATDVTIIHEVDWRELIYQMSQDYDRYVGNEDYCAFQQFANSFIFKNGKTGYEQYYTDIQGFWRDIYHFSNLKYYTIDVQSDVGIKADQQLNLGGQYYLKVGDEFYKFVILKYQKPNNNIDRLIVTYLDKEPPIGNSYSGAKICVDNSYNVTLGLNSDFDPKKSLIDNSLVEDPTWDNEKLKEPSALLYWIDFIGENTELEKLSVKLIGDRITVKTNNKISVLYEQEVPPFIFYETENPTLRTNLSFTPIKVSKEFLDSTKLATYAQSAKTTMDDEINQKTVFSRNISLNTVPIYHLEPNRKIQILDKETNTYGQFIINSISIPLNYNGMMSITVSEVIDLLY